MTIVRILSRATAALCCAALTLSFIASPAAGYLTYAGGRTLTPIVGGNGGEYLHMECNGFDYVAGLAVRYGNWIDAVDINCATPMDYKGKVQFGTAHGASAAWGGQGGAEGFELCGIDEAVGGLRIQRSPNNFVGYIEVLCRSLSDLYGAPHIYGPAGGLGRISDKSPAVQDLICPGGMIAVGIEGATGDFVDRLGLVCSLAPAVAREVIGSGMEDGTDRPGTDYSSTPLGPDPADCQQMCFFGRATCRAWTYVRPGIQGPNAVCHLKRSAPAPVANDCCISGTVRSPMSVLTAPPSSVQLPSSHTAADSVTQRVGDGLHVPKPGGAMTVGEPGGFAGPAPAMTGTFDTDFGVLTLNARDGTYAYKNGRVEIAHIYGDFMDGTWSQSESSQRCTDGTFRGKFHFRFTATGFTGSFGLCDGPIGAGQWNGKRR